MTQRHVAIVGGGNAGLTAAIWAADSGARVTVIEKTARLGGALWFSSASMSAAGTRMQRAKGIEDSPQSHYDDIWRIGRGTSDPALLRLAVDHAAAGIDWLEEIGTPFNDQSPRMAPEHELYSAPRTYGFVPTPGAPPGQGGLAGQTLMRSLLAVYERHEAAGAISTLFRATLAELLIAEDGAVRGLRYEQNGTLHELDADAVILATGGYGASQEKLHRYHPQYGHLISICPPHATGDLLDIAERQGLQLTHMDELVLIPGGLEDPRSPGICVYWSFLRGARPAAQSGDIWVNKLGQRFINETEPRPDPWERAIMAQPDTESFLIFDQPKREGLNEFVREWTKVHIDRHNPPVIVSVPTLEELALKIGVPAANLRETVERYNAGIRSGTDEFGRTEGLHPIDTGPFYAVPGVGTVILTHGGLKVNGRLQVERTDGSAIPNLYACGEAIGAGQVMGDCFAGGQGVGQAVTFGMLAGQWAAGQPGGAEGELSDAALAGVSGGGMQANQGYLTPPSEGPIIGWD